MKLVPLLIDPGFTIAMMGEYQYNGGAGRRTSELSSDTVDRDLRFTSTANRLSWPKIRPPAQRAGGKDVRQEAF